MLHNRMHYFNYGRRNSIDAHHEHHHHRGGSSPHIKEEEEGEESLFPDREDTGSLSPRSADAGGGTHNRRVGPPHDGLDHKSRCLSSSIAPSNIVRDVSGDVTAETTAIDQDRGEGIICDACPGCDDVCSQVKTFCTVCRIKVEAADQKNPSRGYSMKSFSSRGGPLREFTTCQVQRHNKLNDCWICAHGRIYDVSEFMFQHAAGIRPLMQRAGGVQDASVDYDFHSSRSRHNEWRRLCIGRVVPCPLRGDPYGVTKTSSSSEGSGCGIM
ncbi:hypothetical protein Pmar_PMAR001985 [Perkinsus marinus ATCC 50983]|uniref:Cytochrome b5 heme-binding domain-containing protein n=1 Tax=Perkinsus marinus (strain ATCC 50983 / TXsc) TaxID=423536 RepID=C5LYD0_PERM5|nr:hypothetical protein Pmar_PMAR001985 [Perkinsus marinus ATCC 50983]EEQ98168.1 hypothetical protein Pmar_PMAR001985 [Perkinsus marinus ATCC 50983]|eukprot:XP_002765451.1 hypothetical protein Pmar_PMAR001985 [Perkinsus marinus ATCC 50983]